MKFGARKLQLPHPVAYLRRLIGCFYFRGERAGREGVRLDAVLAHLVEDGAGLRPCRRTGGKGTPSDDVWLDAVLAHLVEDGAGLRPCRRTGGKGTPGDDVRRMPPARAA